MLSEDDLAAIQQRSQENLLEFLQVELRLAHTLLATSEVYRVPDNQERALEMVRNAIQTLRHHVGRINDKAAWNRIHRQTDELEAELAKITKQRN